MREILLVILLWGLPSPNKNAAVGQKLSCDVALPKLGVLPGFGWDDLRSIEMAPVTATTYHNCQKTPDGKYVIPDHTFAIPIKTSSVELYSEIIDNWANYSSLTSRSIGVSASSDFFVGSLSASFSYDYKSLKKRQIEDKSITTRTHARYTLYKIGVNPIGSLDPDLLILFNGIFDALHNNDEETADLLAQLIVRDYGTHIIREIEVGALVSKEDYILRQFASTYTDNRKALKTSASAGFLNIMKFDASYKQKTEVKDVEGYEKSMTFSKVDSFGGTLYKPGMSISEWIDSIGGNVVSIDRWGDPLFLPIVPEAFPNVSISLVSKLREKIERVIFLYYSRNSHKGCMDIGSKNFEYNANVDGFCDPPDNKYYFGGVYQKCQNPEGFNGQDFCTQHNMLQKNIYTGDYSCQSPFYSVPLKSGHMTVIGQKYNTKCSGVWFWKKCWKVGQSVLTKISYSGYWCAADGNLKTNNTGEMFGGLFTHKAENPVTHAQTCPPTFLDTKILQDLHICVGTDYELGYKYSIPFGGFFSCQSGNPLVKVLNDTRKTRIKTKALSDIDMDALLQYCPKGYTQHTAVVEENCLVNYCVKAGSFREHGDMPIVLPPFQNFTNANGTTWKNVILPETAPEGSGNQSQNSGIAFSGIALGFFLAFIFLAAVVGMLMLVGTIKKRYFPVTQNPANITDEENGENESESEDANLLSS